MKLKGLTKLVLAGTALAATAATLTTSTYAWYVTNNKVEATGVSGATAGDSVAGSLLISEVDSANNTELPKGYTTSITLDTAAQTTPRATKGLYPQSKAAYAKTKDTALNNEKTYYEKDGSQYTAVQTPNVANIGNYYEKDVWVDKDGVIIDTPTMVTFSFWLKSSSAMNGISVETSFANSATTVASRDSLRQTFYSGTGLPTGKKAKDTYTVDAVYALRMEVVQESFTLTYGYEADGTTRKYADDVKTAVADSKTTAVVGAVENHNATHDNTAQYASPKEGANDIFDSPTGDANQYYKSVMKKAPFGTTGFGEADQTAAAVTGASPDAPDATWTSINLAKDVDTLITITVWLEGTDAQCWDSCVGQDFTLNLKFEKSGS